MNRTNQAYVREVFVRKGKIGKPVPKDKNLLTGILACDIILSMDGGLPHPNTLKEVAT